MSICFHYTKFRKQFQSAFPGVNWPFRFLSLCGNEECTAMDKKKKKKVLLGHSMTLLVSQNPVLQCSSKVSVFLRTLDKGCLQFFSTLQNPWILICLPIYKGASKEKQLPEEETFLVSLSEMATHGNR